MIEPITAEQIEQAYREARPNVMLASAAKVYQIVAETAFKHEVSIRDMKGPSRFRPYVIARQEAMSRIVRECGWSQPRTGRYFGGRDHTTVRHALKAHDKRGASQ